VVLKNLIKFIGSKDLAKSLGYSFKRKQMSQTHCYFKRKKPVVCHAIFIG